MIILDADVDTETPGVVLLLFSLVLTRGISVVAAEFRSALGLVSLIGDDACCEQVCAHTYIQAH